MSQPNRLVVLCASVLTLCAAAPARAAGAAAVSLTVLASAPGARIDRHIFGQFSEHLGNGIYGGIWVGRGSPIPNTRGIRNDVVAALKALHVPVVRWPGGCFADEYHWRDGIGPRAQRPVRINTHWGGVTESNAFGTHEYFDFLRMIGADAYITGNLGSGSPQEMADWVEYITSDSDSTLAQLRRRNGAEKPWQLPFFGIGNEAWGCGGNMRPEYYADLFRRYATFVRDHAPKGTELVASGAHDDDYHWTDVVMARAGAYMDALSLHYYTIPTGNWKHKGPAYGFGEDQWASTLTAAERIERYISGHEAIMDKYDPQKRVALFVDEWGTWYDPQPGSNPGFLYQQNSLRDALVAAITLDIFMRHADRVRMANIAQMINVLQAMILTRGERMILTPTYYVFRLYVPFQDATYLPVRIETPSYRYGSMALPAVDATAARDASGTIHLALVNLDPHHAATVSVRIDGASAHAASGEVLTANAMDAHNTFEHPDAIRPAPFKGKGRHGRLLFRLPPKSVAVVALH
ncbi:MAG TPA: alpha-N-arabinofuranosidase [Steroidobacteraceae bacterium]|nr:alpha-N-arabinofuranosidase [Steroidobacteraceae bacterium]